MFGVSRSVDVAKMRIGGCTDALIARDGNGAKFGLVKWPNLCVEWVDHWSIVNLWHIAPLRSPSALNDIR